MRRYLAMVVVVLAGCDADTPQQPEPISLSGDVVVSSTGVVLHARQTDTPCSCTNDLPALGTCRIPESWERRGCDCPDPLPCLADLRLERDGQVVFGEPQRDPHWGAYTIVADLTEPAELVLTGCGDDIRIPVHANPPSDPPVLTDVCMVDGALEARWEPVTPGAVALVHDYLGGKVCRSEDQGRLALGASFPRVGLDILHPDGQARTPVGELRLWQATAAEQGERVVSRLEDPFTGVYDLHAGTAALSMTIDGEEEPVREVRLSDVSIRLDSEDPNDTLSLSGSVRSDRVGNIYYYYYNQPVPGWLGIEIDSVYYAASGERIAPSPGLSSDLRGHQRIVLAVPTTTMTASTGATREVSFELTYDLGFVAAECAP